MDDDDYDNDYDYDTDDTDDDIARWAESLSPEGSPGIISQKMRAYLGDKGYEKALAQNDAAAALYLQKRVAINNLLTIAATYSFIFGLVALVAFVAFVIRYIFG